MRADPTDKVAIPIIRSNEDGHQETGPICRDHMSVAAYKAFFARQPWRMIRGERKQLWSLEAIVWIKAKEQPPSPYDLVAEIIEPDPRPSGPFFAMLTRRR